MAQIVYRGNLSSATFPMTVADAGRSVIIPGSDNNYDRRVDPAGEGKDAGIPQAIYMENVLPTPGGYQSVGYAASRNITMAGRTIASSHKVSIITPTIIDQNNYPIQLVFFTNGTVDCMFVDAVSAWAPAILPGTYVTPDGPALLISETRISSAVVRGVTYLFIFSSFPRLYTLTRVTGGSAAVTFTDITATLVGITAVQILCICASYNYLVVIDSINKSIRWSSTTTPVDFTASLVSGAGAETPNGLNSDLVYLLAHPAGFYVYSHTETIASSYTGNARYPWKFKVIADSSGIDYIQQITSGAKSNAHYSIDANGRLRELQVTGSQDILPEVSKFLYQSKIYDNFNYAANIFSVVYAEPQTFPTLGLLNRLYRRIWYVLDRYLIVSYGLAINTFDYCIVYDTFLKRYGKLKITHNIILEGENYLQFLSYTTGVVSRLSLDMFDATALHYSVLVLGKFQYVRSRFLQLEEVELESSQQAALISPIFEVALLPSLDGKNFNTSVTPASVISTAALRTYACHIHAQNVSVVVKGAFDLNTIVLKFSPGGKR